MRTSELAAQLSVRIPAAIVPSVDERLESLQKETRLTKSKVVAYILAGATLETIEAGRRAVENAA